MLLDLCDHYAKEMVWNTNQQTDEMSPNRFYRLKIKLSVDYMFKLGTESEFIWAYRFVCLLVVLLHRQEMSYADKQPGCHGDDKLNPHASVSFDVCRFRLYLSCPITHNLSNGNLYLWYRLSSLPWCYLISKLAQLSFHINVMFCHEGMKECQELKASGRIKLLQITALELHRNI